MNKEKEAIGALLDTYLGGGGELFDPTTKASAPDDRQGQEITVTGYAVHTASGAAVRVGSEDMVVAGVDGWDDDVIGERIEVTGTYTSASLAPDPLLPGGEIGHGAQGNATVLSNATRGLVR